MGNQARESVVLKAELKKADGELLSSNLLYFTEPKNLTLSNPEIKREVEQTQEGFKVKLSSKTLAKNVYLLYEEAEGFFSDNYFDLLPNSPVEITFKTTHKASDFAEKLQVVSLVDSYIN